MYDCSGDDDDDDDGGDDDDDDWSFTATFVHMVGQMGRATSKGNEAKIYDCCNSNANYQYYFLNSWTTLIICQDRDYKRYNQHVMIGRKNQYILYQLQEDRCFSDTIFILEVFILEIILH